MPKPEKQWTRRNGVITKKPIGWSTRDQVKRHKELKHNLNTAPTTSEEYALTYTNTKQTSTNERAVWENNNKFT